MTDSNAGEVGLKILVAVIWVPIQITLSLLFATGGLFLLVILGIVFSPLIGLFFLARWAVRRGRGDADEATTHRVK